MMWSCIVLLVARVAKADGGAEGAAECRELSPITTPEELKRELAADDAIVSVVEKTRAAIKDILDGRDDRLLAVVGPCSIHDRASAMEFAERLAELSRCAIIRGECVRAPARVHAH